MANYTENLGLFKYDVITDENVPFSITNALNNNWDILDEAVKGCGSSRNVGEIISSILPLTDAGLHLLDGALIEGNGIYAEFVDYIAELYTDNPTANYFCTEAQWQASVTQYGSCGKFVYDSTNNTIRLPKVSDILQGTTDLTALGNLVEAGLPSHAHSGTTDWVGNHIHGCPQGTSEDVGGNQIYASGDDMTAAIATWVNSGEAGAHNHSFTTSQITDAIYGNSNTVQPQTIRVLYYIVIATSTKTDIQVDIDEIATDLNGKADVNLSNVTPSVSFKSNSVSWCMPDYVNQIIGQSNGWVQCAKDSFICIWGSDPYSENFNVEVSPNNGTDRFTVGVRYDDTNGNTEATSFTFLCPKNWYFRCTSEQTPTYVIFPLKGAN